MILFPRPLNSWWRESEVSAVQGQVRVIGVVMGDEIRPCLLHESLLLFKTSGFLGGFMFVTPCGGLMVEEFGKRGVDVPQPFGGEFQAQIDVIESNGKVGFIKAANGKEMLFLHGETSGGDGGIFIGEGEAALKPGVIATEFMMDVPCYTSNADNDTSVLNAFVGIEQFRTNRADARLHGMTDHCRQPIMTDDLRVVVEQNDIFASTMLNGIVVQGAVIEWAVVPDNPEAMETAEFGEISQGIGIVRTVIDKDNLIIPVVRFPQNAGDALLDKFLGVSRRDDDGNQGGIVAHVIDGPVTKADELGFSHGPGAPVMLIDSSFSCEHGIGLFISAKGGTAFGHAPVIEHMRHMVDLFGPDQLDAAQGQIIVLRPVKLASEAADLLDERAMIDPQMGDEVVRTEQFKVPVAFEIGVIPVSVRGQLILIGIKQTDARLSQDGLSHAEQRMLAQDIIVIEKRQPFPGGYFNGAVGSFGNVSVGFPMDDLYPAVSSRIFVQNASNVRRCGTVVRDTQFPITVSLIDDASDSFPQETFRGVVDRHDDRKCGFRFPCVHYALHRGDVACSDGIVIRHPTLVGRLDRRLRGFVSCSPFLDKQKMFGGAHPIHAGAERIAPIPLRTEPISQKAFDFLACSQHDNPFVESRNQYAASWQGKAEL